MWAMMGWGVGPVGLLTAGALWLKLFCDCDDDRVADEEEEADEAEDEEDWGGGVDGEKEMGEADIEDGKELLTRQNTGYQRDHAKEVNRSNFLCERTVGQCVEVVKKVDGLALASLSSVSL